MNNKPTLTLEQKAFKLRDVLHKESNRLGLNSVGLVIIDEPTDLEGNLMSITPRGSYSKTHVELLREYANELEAYFDKALPEVVH